MLCVVIDISAGTIAWSRLLQHLLNCYASGPACNFLSFTCFQRAQNSVFAIKYSWEKLLMCSKCPCLTRHLQHARQLLADRIVHFFVNVANKDTKTTVRHFVIQEEIPRSTVHNILQRYKERGNSLNKIPPGRPVSQSTLALIEKVRMLFENDPYLSERAAAAKVGISKTYLRQIKVKLGIKPRRRQKEDVRH